ncbi:HlyD family efflux transporter periplasmic adaptor subunit [Aeoliella sp. ICT_H6.2]|uniref:HlyD family efflux transporter periplasmic adaptor subunit n=1 Tax=Aeoliella straminimaris TaxID=2954799 RepID=A0A9X2F940_9BACT|nr:HlyD family efflux transporter periplasmic adaptor subunit [Aeoliella straminimaris]MCO6043882.1 HlyD family efflux transporter periplasmic adaptor subunit [Aeoliella straminimaris]
MVPSNGQRPPRGLVQILLVAVLAIAAIAGGVLWYRSTTTNDEASHLVLHEVERDDFELSITERGELEAAGVTEVRSEVKTQNQPGLAILRVVEEGVHVKAGDFLLELDSSALDAERTTQQNVVNLAEATVVETRNLYETALIAKEEYIQGTYIQERTTIEGEIFVAEENLNRAREYYQFSQKLAAKGHINELQLEADKFAVEKSEKELEAAKTKLHVLDDYTRPKMIKQLDSDIVITEAKWGSAKKSYELELETLQEIEDQIAKCTIYAPKDGVVIYNNDRDRHGNEDWIVEEGAEVRERQVIFRLPDSSAMRVELKVNEALVQYVKAGLPATVRPIGTDGLELHGQVTSVSRYAEPGNWRKADVKEYKAYVSIEEESDGLRSGMTASVTVKCDFVADAIQIPVQSVLPHGDDFYCLVRKAGKWTPQKLKVGPTNTEFFVIEQGVDEGDLVAMNPRQYLASVELPELPPTKQKGNRLPGPPTTEESVADSTEPAQTTPTAATKEDQTAT